MNPSVVIVFFLGYVSRDRVNLTGIHFTINFILVINFNETIRQYLSICVYYVRHRILYGVGDKDWVRIWVGSCWREICIAGTPSPSPPNF